MRKFLFLITMTLAAATMAFGTPVCVAPPSVDVTTGGAFTCTLGGLTFSNFVATDAGNVPVPQVWLTGAAVVGSTVNLTFNPGLDASVHKEDIYFSFMVTGGIVGVDLTNAGTGLTSIGETVCAVPLVNNACPAPASNILANFTGPSQSYTHVTLAQPVSVIYVWKDIFATADDSPGAAPNPGHLSSFTESFDTPEPMTFALIGSGLLGLGLLRRRARKG